MTHHTHTAEYLNARHHPHGFQVTDKDGYTWTRTNNHWEVNRHRRNTLPKTYEPYTPTMPTTWKDVYNNELAKAVDAYIDAENTHGKGIFHNRLITTNWKPRSQGLFQTIPSTWTKPTNLLPPQKPTSTHNMLKTAQHIFGIDEATGNTGHEIGWDDYYRYYNNLPNNEHIHWAPNQKQTSIEYTTTRPTQTPNIQEKEHTKIQETTPQNDPINPDYYKFPSGAETIDISEHLTSNGGQAIQYVARSTRLDGHNKGDIVENLQKAIWFLNREIDRLTTTKD